MKINKTDNYIEVIGHYDNEIQCAKMTLLADLYAIEHRSGYAKFPLSVEDKLKRVDERLEFGAETWVINEVPNWFNTMGDAVIDESISFSSNNTDYTKFHLVSFSGRDAKEGYLQYNNETVCTTGAYNPNFWTDQNYRTVTFTEPPTGDLKTWLETNAEKQTPPINYEYKQLATKEDLDSKLDNSKQAIASKGGLVTPSAVLSSNELVGVGVNGEQIRVQLGEGLTLEGTGSPYTLKGATIQTTAPTSEINDGLLHIVILSSAPATEYNGYIYLIKE